MKHVTKTGQSRCDCGQTLAEIVVVIAIVLLLVTGLVVGATASLKAAQYGRLKSGAVNYTQDAVEVTRSLRDASWSNLLSFSAANGGVWCLDAGENWTQASGGNCPVSLNNLYARRVTFTWSDPTMQIDVLVTWSDGAHTYTTTLRTYYTNWQ